MGSRGGDEVGGFMRCDVVTLLNSIDRCVFRGVGGDEEEV